MGGPHSFSFKTVGPGIHPSIVSSFSFRTRKEKKRKEETPRERRHHDPCLKVDPWCSSSLPGGLFSFLSSFSQEREERKESHSPGPQTEIEIKFGARVAFL